LQTGAVCLSIGVLSNQISDASCRQYHFIERKKDFMTRKLLAVLVFALAVPATAIACSEKAQAQKTDDSQVLVAQNDPSTPKPTKAKGAKKSKKSKKPMMQ
jgi:hypothetical protein